jgi:hypothetical protein
MAKRTYQPAALCVVVHMRMKSELELNQTSAVHSAQLDDNFTPKERGGGQLHRKWFGVRIQNWIIRFHSSGHFILPV